MGTWVPKDQIPPGLLAQIDQEHAHALNILKDLVASAATHQAKVDCMGLTCIGEDAARQLRTLSSEVQIQVLSLSIRALAEAATWVGQHIKKAEEDNE